MQSEKSTGMPRQGCQGAHSLWYSPEGGGFFAEAPHGTYVVCLSSFLSCAPSHTPKVSPAQRLCPVGPALTPLHLSLEGREEERRAREKLLDRPCMDDMEA